MFEEITIPIVIISFCAIASIGLVVYRRTRRNRATT